MLLRVARLEYLSSELEEGLSGLSASNRALKDSRGKDLFREGYSGRLEDWGPVNKDLSSYNVEKLPWSIHRCGERHGGVKPTLGPVNVHSRHLASKNSPSLNSANKSLHPPRRGKKDLALDMPCTSKLMLFKLLPGLPRLGDPPLNDFGEVLWPYSCGEPWHRSGGEGVFGSSRGVGSGCGMNQRLRSSRSRSSTQCRPLARSGCCLPEECVQVSGRTCRSLDCPSSRPSGFWR
mmetsp:Transcript_11272/g.32416  ORF Transcript_11272/g.32416 Transcript_11272/m.32416 type:complete len:234 (-) Transcript_11272:608-1309(-)